MRVPAVPVLVGTAAVLLLAGCTGVSTPQPTGTPPPFLATTADTSHSIPAAAISSLNIVPGTIRYQGDYQGRGVFLVQEVSQPSDACLAVGKVGGDGSDFVDACGRAAFAIALGDAGNFRYNEAGWATPLANHTAVGTYLQAAGGVAAK